MASTNKTTHYDLSQYVANDKPTYLTDYNGDMSAIDTGIYNAQTKADSAYTLAGTAEGKADNATLTANSALTNAGTANTNIGTMANLETTDKTSVVNAINENTRNIDNFNLTSYENATNISVTNGTVESGGLSLKVARNSDGSIAKIYGHCHISSIPSSASNIVLTFNTSLRPTSSFYIDSTIFAQMYSVGSASESGMTGFTLNTDGSVSITAWKANAGITDINIDMIPIVLWIKDFGDVPAPQQ